MWQAKHIINRTNYYSVEVVNLQDNRSYWVDVSISDSGDIDTEWNQYIFNTRNSEDILRQATQDDPDNFIEATNEAINFLEEENYIEQLDDGTWIEVI